mmetsp:Transcript_12740/g.21793  ORF Transcript_12740/g.21793 Transcript_12740/m.21793 type:complete len:209 (+) Transcript_12740:673-1299(+)
MLVLFSAYLASASNRTKTCLSRSDDKISRDMSSYLAIVLEQVSAIELNVISDTSAETRSYDREKNLSSKVSTCFLFNIPSSLLEISKISNIHAPYDTINPSAVCTGILSSGPPAFPGPSVPAVPVVPAMARAATKVAFSISPLLRIYLICSKLSGINARAASSIFSSCLATDGLQHNNIKLWQPNLHVCNSLVLTLYWSSVMFNRESS